MQNLPTQELDAPHRLTLDGRSRLTITGVLEVESFDEESVALVTARGALLHRGQGLHVQMLSLEGGQVSVDGSVDSLSYEDPVPAGGFFARLFGGWSCRCAFRRSSSRRQSRSVRRWACFTICCARCGGVRLG